LFKLFFVFVFGFVCVTRAQNKKKGTNSVTKKKKKKISEGKKKQTYTLLPLSPFCTQKE